MSALANRIKCACCRALCLREHTYVIADIGHVCTACLAEHYDEVRHA